MTNNFWVLCVKGFPKEVASSPESAKDRQKELQKEYDHNDMTGNGGLGARTKNVLVMECLQVPLTKKEDKTVSKNEYHHSARYPDQYAS